MKSKMLLLTMPLLIAACSTAPSDVPTKADQTIIPDVVGYTENEQKQAFHERQKYCSVTPMMCRMINDYGKMRDQSRAALNLFVDIDR